MKICAGCNVAKPIVAFELTGNKSGGHRSKCRTCRELPRKAYYACNAQRYRDRAAAWRKENPEKFKAAAKLWRDTNPVRVRELGRRWRAKNLGKVRASATAWNRRNATKRRKYQQSYMAANRDLYAAYSARRRAAVLRAVPVWADTDKIRGIYAVAGRRGMEVDHVVPLQAPIVCGLHWEGNLQILEVSANRKKGNRYWPDMP